MKAMCTCHGRCANPHLGLLLLRIATGAVFIYHGWMKLQNLEGARAFFGSLHLYPWLAPAVAALEVVGGAALILGVFTCFFASLLALNMAVAIVTAKWGQGWGKMELEVMLLAATLALKSTGAGRWKAWKSHCGCFMCKNKAHNICEHGKCEGENCDCDCHK